MAAERVVLIRHGQSVWNAAGRWQGQGGPGLTALGHRQAEITARFLAVHEPEVAAVVASDLPRVTETVAPTAEALGLPVHTDERLREIDVGWWSGLTSTEVMQHAPDVMAAFRSGDDVPRGGAETDRQLRDRVTAALVELVSSCDGGTMLVFSHGGPVRALVGATLGLSIAQQRSLAGPGNCSRTMLVYESQRPRLRCYNETAHLRAPETGDARRYG